jgi:hypothetical protein
MNIGQNLAAVMKILDHTSNIYMTLREYREIEREITQINYEEETNGHMKANETVTSHQRIQLINRLQ